jgi:hypothetical protein
VVVDGVTWTAVPVVTVRLPGVMTPEPPVKTAVRLDVEPAGMVDGMATKLVMAGTGSTVTVTVEVAAVPTVGVTVRV